MALEFDPKKIAEQARRVGLLARAKAARGEALTREFAPEKIAAHARKVRGLARLFDAACEFSLAADTFDAAADLFGAAGRAEDAEGCRELSDANAVQAMDRILRLVAAEVAP